VTTEALDHESLYPDRITEPWASVLVDPRLVCDFRLNA
jgi:hypothetical protein